MDQTRAEVAPISHSRSLLTKRTFVVLLILVLCAASPWLIPKKWSYTLEDRSGNATLFFREPSITITLEGLSTNGGKTTSFVYVSGYGFGGGTAKGGEIDSYESYWLGWATIKLNDYTIDIKNRGHKIICCGKSFPVQAGVPLALRIDPSGKVHLAAKT